MELTPSQLATAMSTAERWAAEDPDRATKAETIALLNMIPLGDDDAARAVVSQFGSRLSFGTAGLRGELGPGPARMNRAVVIQTSAGFARFLTERAERGESAETPTVVIGFDARVNSDVFARDAAEVFRGAGFRSILLPGPLPTPVTAFTVRHYGASAGVMITASHNPPRDNGYKVYLGDADAGSQICTPADVAITEHIEAVAARPLDEIPLDRDYEMASRDIIEAYVTETAAAIQADAVARPATAPHIVYTAMHGVGSEVTRAVFTAANLPTLTVVDSQDQPDGSFPTVPFPNPEEPGALDQAIARAREVEADLIIAHDPDADRLAVALPDPADPTVYTRLTGNQLGLVLGWQAARRAEGQQGALACTIVSSPALQAVANAYGLDYAETLSGFKWVSRVPNLVFGFEEALGYLTRPNLVRDKDGISAAGDLVSLVLELAAEDKTLWDHLDDATERFGCFASSQITVRLEHTAQVSALAARIRTNPPQAFGAFRVTALTDLLTPGAAEVPADVLRFDLDNGSRVMIRPSGTEPKLKIYLDTFSDRGDVAERRANAERLLATLEGSVRDVLDAASPEGF